MKSHHVYYFVISLLRPWPTLGKKNRTEHSRTTGKLLCEILLCWCLFHTYTHAHVCVSVIVLSQNRKCTSYCGLQSKWFIVTVLLNQNSPVSLLPVLSLSLPHHLPWSLINYPSNWSPLNTFAKSVSSLRLLFPPHSTHAQTGELLLIHRLLQGWPFFQKTLVFMLPSQNWYNIVP